MLDAVRRFLDQRPVSVSWEDFHSRCVHSNGRLREAALRDLPGLPAARHAQALPCVIARLNDWVPQVRAAAVEALQPLLRDDLEGAWLAALPDVVHFMCGERWRADGGAARDAIERFLLSSPQRRSALLACAPGQAPTVRRWLVQQGWHHGDTASRQAALCEALQGTDVRLAGQALRELQRVDAAWQDWPGVRDALARVRFPGLRLLALRDEQARGRMPEGEAARALVFSAHAATRRWRLFHAAAAEKAEWLAQAETRLAAGGPSRIQILALLVLGDLRAPSLPAHLQSAARAASPRLRETAHRLAQGILDDDARTAWALAALVDPSPRVQAAGLDAMRRGRAALGVEELHALAMRTPGASRAVLQALEPFAPWTRAAATLDVLAASTVDAFRAAEILRDLHRALRRSLYAPTAAQVAAVRDAAERLRACRPELTFTPP